ncbi:MAG: hypothetical protein OEU35_09440 [Desulfuromonadales bacterium]|nr:hypothetical protein [Desulfuromonadales bacterium]
METIIVSSITIPVSPRVTFLSGQVILENSTCTSPTNFFIWEGENGEGCVLLAATCLLL